MLSLEESDVRSFSVSNAMWACIKLNFRQSAIFGHSYDWMLANVAKIGMEDTISCLKALLEADFYDQGLFMLMLRQSAKVLRDEDSVAKMRDVVQIEQERVPMVIVAMQIASKCYQKAAAVAVKSEIGVWKAARLFPANEARRAEILKHQNIAMKGRARTPAEVMKFFKKIVGFFAEYLAATHCMVEASFWSIAL